MDAGPSYSKKNRSSDLRFSNLLIIRRSSDRRRFQAGSAGGRVADPGPGPKEEGRDLSGAYLPYHTPERKLFLIEYSKSSFRTDQVAFLRGYVGTLQWDGYLAYDVLNVHRSMMVTAAWCIRAGNFQTAVIIGWRRPATKLKRWC